ncbi:MAG: LamG-like jellyroll fold domain-containing protein [bacterium]|nr:LamG-like jellyroll fold domain-containing protein [bacterium]
MTNRSSFTLIELLVVIAILAILSVAIVIVINPADLIRQSRDTNRLTDLNQLNKAISLFDVTNPNDFTGTSSIVYVSIPDTSGTCVNLSLPTLPAGYTYNCVTTSTLIKTDGTGWIPVNFSAISYGSPIQRLPIDPTNTTSSGQYYSYIPGGSWELNGSFESEKYRANPQKSKTNLPGVIAVGTDLSLNPSYREPAIGQSQTLGADLVSGWNFTSGWTVGLSATINNATTFTAGAANSYIYRNTLTTAGVRYHLRIAGTVSVGNFYIVKTAGQIGGTYSGAFDYTVDFTAIDGLLGLRAVTSGAVVNITTFTLELITQESGSLVFDVMNNAGTIQDITGSKTVTNTSVSAPNISRNNVMEFNGSTSKLDLGADFIGTGDYSVAGWIYVDSTGEDGMGRIIDNGKFSLYIQSNILRLSSSLSSGPWPVMGTIQYGQWYHIILTRTSASSNNVTSYINGVLSGTANQSSGTPVAGTTNVVIGNNSGGSGTFDGYIYRLKGYNRILNTTEIQQLFNSQRFLFGI